MRRKKNILVKAYFKTFLCTRKMTLKNIPTYDIYVSYE